MGVFESVSALDRAGDPAAAAGFRRWILGGLAAVSLGCLSIPAPALAQARTVFATNYAGGTAKPGNTNPNGDPNRFTAKLANVNLAGLAVGNNCQPTLQPPVFAVQDISGQNSNTPGFYAPAVFGQPAITLTLDRWASQSAACAASPFTPTLNGSITFSAPIDPNALRFHFQNLDSGSYQFGGVTAVRLAGNTQFTVQQGWGVNPNAVTALGGGCMTDAGANPSGRCGTVNFTAPTATITSLSWVGTDVDGGSFSGDGHQLAFSIDQPSLLIRKQTLNGAGINNFVFNYPANVVTNAATGDVAATTETIAVNANGSFVNGQQRYIANSGLDTAVTEAVPANWRLTAGQCIDIANNNAVIATLAAPVNGPANATLTLTAASVAPNSQIQCSFTNTSLLSSLQLAKAWAAGSVAGDQVTIGATAGGTNNTAAFTATAPTAANSGTAVVVTVGNTITLPAEAGADAANYTTTVACSGGHTLSGSNGQQANTLTITSGNPAVCTYTNTPRTATLQLAKAWAAGSVAGHQVTIGATAGGTNNTAAFTATAPTAANSGTAVAVTVGNVITLPAEAGANAANYTTTLACTGGHTLSGSNGQQANTLTIVSANPAVCTYTNTLRTADLAITKTNTPASGANDQAGDTVVAGTNTTYTVVVSNRGAEAVTGAVVRDTPQAGLNCPAGNPVTCSGAACPGGAITIGDLAAGVTLGTLAAGATATFGFSCAVQ